MIHAYTIFTKEWRCLRGSDRGTFILYGLLVLSWALLFASSDGIAVASNPIWLVSFSVIIASNFASSVYVAERMNGSMEVLFTSGFSRDAILFGKMAFVAVVTMVLGFACLGIASFFEPFLAVDRFAEAQPMLNFSSVFLYVVSSVLNAASSAYLSVRFSNPRLLYFINILFLGTIVAIYSMLSMVVVVNLNVLSVFLILLTLLFVVLSRKAFHGEKIVQPVII